MAKAAERLSRHELKDPDAFVEAVAPLVDSLEKNWKGIVLVTGGVLTLALAVIIGISVSSHHDEQAAEQLGGALANATKQVVSNPDSAADDKTVDYFSSEKEKQEALAKALDKVEQQQAGSMAARTGLLPQGDADYRLGKNAEALRAYTRYLDLAPANDTLRAFALQGQAYAFLSEGKGDEAIAAAKRLIDSPPAGFGRDLGLLAEGHIAEQLGKIDVAKDAYQKLSVDYPTAASGREASERLTALGAPPPSPTPAALHP